MKLSIITVNNNMCVLLRQSLNSLINASHGIDYELLVVDNASSDNSVQMVKDNFPTVKIIENKVDVGYSKAANQAVKQATGDYVLLINTDTITKKDTLDKTLEFMDKHPIAGGVSVRMLDPMGNFLTESKRGLTSAWTLFFKLTGLSRMLSKSRLYDRNHKYWTEEFETTEVDILSGAFMLLRRSVLQHTGLFDERFFMHGQDIDLSFRMRMTGFKNYYFPKTYIINFKEHSLPEFSWQYIKNFFSAMFIFAGKYMFKLPQLHIKGMGPILTPSYEVER